MFYLRVKFFVNSEIKQRNDSPDDLNEMEQ